MSDPGEITVKVWKASGSEWRLARQIGTWTSLEFSPWHLAAGPWSLEMPWSDQARGFAKDRLVTFDFRGRRFTGVIEDFSTRTDQDGKPILVLTGSDALTLLGDLLVTPSTPPTSTSPATFSAARYKASGPAETVLSSLISSQVKRVGLPITVAASQGRGRQTDLSLRFTNLLDITARKARAAGLGVRCTLEEMTGARGQLVVSFTEPRDVSSRVRLSHKVGTLRSWEQHEIAPTATRAWVAGDGKGVNRTFLQVLPSETDDPRIESQWGRVRETLVDARGISDDGTVTGTALTEAFRSRGIEALSEAGAQAAFQLETAEVASMRAFEHYDVGDKVLVELLTDVSQVLRLGSIRVTADQAGVTVSPIPGNPSGGDPLFRQADYIRSIRAQVRALEREDG